MVIFVGPEIATGKKTPSCDSYGIENDEKFYLRSMKRTVYQTKRDL